MKKPYNTIKEDQLFAHEKLIVSANGTQLKGIIPEQDTKVFYLKGLNGLRALAAIFVLIYHISAAYKIGQLYKLGESSVTIFFTLSGFLITFLLLKEIEKTNTIK
ncbi:MAG: acyltransferase family protein, partial [Ginsengibacter sp.]